MCIINNQLNKVEKKIEEFREDMKRRQRYRDQLKSVRDQIKILRKALRGTTRPRH